MLNKSDLQKQVCSLDLLIRVISFEMVKEPDYHRQGETQSTLIKEMEEALCQLRQARGLRKILLTALENESGKSIARKQAASAMNRIAA